MLKYTALLSQEFRRSSSISNVKNKNRVYTQTDQNDLSAYHAKYNGNQNYHKFSTLKKFHGTDKQPQRYRSITKIQYPQNNQHQYYSSHNNHERRATYNGDFRQYNKVKEFKTIQTNNTHEKIFKDLNTNDITLRNIQNHHKFKEQTPLRKIDNRAYDRKLQFNPKTQSRNFQINTMDQIQKKIQVSLKNSKLKI